MRLNDPAGGAQSINVSINTTVSPPSRGISVGGAGNLNVVMAEDGTVILLNLAAGVAHPYKVKTIYTAGTTATNVVILR